MSEVEIRPAATVVVCRDGVDGLEVFLSKRTPKAAFMASAYVYPGGRVDAADRDPAFTAHGVDGVERFEDDLPLDDVVAHVVGAIRESFEEAGVLFAGRADGAPIAWADPSVAARFTEYRAALNAGSLGFAELVTRESLRLDFSAFDYFAHWVTPPFESRRFDTRFYIARLPAGQTPVPDYNELVAGDWFTPAAALRAYAAGEIQLAPPTIYTLTDFARTASAAEATAWAAAEVPVSIEPVMVPTAAGPALRLPGHPEHPATWSVPGPKSIVMRGERFVVE